MNDSGLRMSIEKRKTPPPPSWMIRGSRNYKAETTGTATQHLVDRVAVSYS